jgi:hypothetical protein
MEINLTSVDRSLAGGSYGDNFRQLGKPTEVARLNPIAHARLSPASMPTRSDLSPLPLPHHPTSALARPPAGTHPPPPTAPVQLQPDVASSSTPPPPLQSVPPRAPPRRLQLQPGVASSPMPPLPPLQSAPPCRHLLRNSGRWL